MKRKATTELININKRQKLTHGSTFSSVIKCCMHVIEYLDINTITHLYNLYSSEMKTLWQINGGIIKIPSIANVGLYFDNDIREFNYHVVLYVRADGDRRPGGNADYYTLKFNLMIQNTLTGWAQLLKDDKHWTFSDHCCWDGSENTHKMLEGISLNYEDTENKNKEQVGIKTARILETVSFDGVDLTDLSNHFQDQQDESKVKPTKGRKKKKKKKVKKYQFVYTWWNVGFQTDSDEYHTEWDSCEIRFYQVRKEHYNSYHAKIVEAYKDPVTNYRTLYNTWAARWGKKGQYDEEKDVICLQILQRHCNKFTDRTQAWREKYKYDIGWLEDKKLREKNEEILKDTSSHNIIKRNIRLTTYLGAKDDYSNFVYHPKCSGINDLFKQLLNDLGVTETSGDYSDYDNTNDLKTMLGQYQQQEIEGKDYGNPKFLGFL